jgi:GNAT superfamily N-acetyltransferase
MQDPITLRLTDPDAPAALTCLAAYSRFLAATIPAEGPAPIPLPLADAAAYRTPQGAVLVAFQAETPVACVCLRTLSPGLGEVKRLYVAPAARGQGLARRLMQAIETQARALGLTRLNLDTNAALTPAIALYRASGWLDTAPYTGFPATHWFTKDL